MFTNVKTKNNFWPAILKFLKIKVQKVGSALSGMIMPIIGVIIAWGLLTSFFLDTGWTPVSVINEYVVGNMLTFCIPLLIGFLGGQQIYGAKGGYIGAASTLGVIAGALMFSSDNTIWPVKEDLGAQFLGAMIVGPLSAYCFKKIEILWKDKVKSGFEMLVDNFSIGIFGFVFILFSFFIVPWFSYGLTWILKAIVDPLTNWKALPVVSFFVEPAKPFFLNNAINHGIFTPLGTQQVQETGKSILFYIESNPGPGLGVLLAYMIMDKKQRGAAGSASIIHFFGGIHEVSFPFILMRPVLIIATTLGGVTGVAILQIFNAGAVSAASPGSIIALFAVSAHGASDYIGLSLSVLTATVVSLTTGIFLMRFTAKHKISIHDAVEKVSKLKDSKSKYLQITGATPLNYNNIKSIIFACDAGMGSSAMGAGVLKKLFKTHQLDVKVKNVAIRNLNEESPDLIVVQNQLANRAKKHNKAPQYVIDNFLNKVQYENLVKKMTSQSSNESKAKLEVTDSSNKSLTSFINAKVIKLQCQKTSYQKAIDQVGELMISNQMVTKEYLPSMHRRNEDVSVYIGNHVAIPHGDSQSNDFVKKSGIIIFTYPEGIDWKGETVKLVVGIASKREEHMSFVSALGAILAEESKVDKIVNAKNVQQLKGLFSE